mmetsp:Transcript_119404/g.380807  ORF Transcript_119404/g.380807 Transcript_119404/m.380807 type:complete len:267 (+) Transcript_119404:205-1005(+)
MHPKALEPPMPPKPNLVPLPVPLASSTHGLCWKPKAQLDSKPKTLSTPGSEGNCSRAAVSDLSRRTSPSAPPFANNAHTLATSLAEPCRLTAGISACRHSAEFTTEGRNNKSGSNNPLGDNGVMDLSWSMVASGQLDNSAQLARRPCANPKCKSRPRGSATSRRKNVPRLTPASRRTRAAHKCPKVIACSANTSPGGHSAACAATLAVNASSSRSSRKPQPGGTKGAPALCSNSCLTVQASLPPCANSGQYSVTRLSAQRSPLWND